MNYIVVSTESEELFRVTNADTLPPLHACLLLVDKQYLVRGFAQCIVPLQVANGKDYRQQRGFTYVIAEELPLARTNALLQRLVDHVQASTNDWGM